MKPEVSHIAKFKLIGSSVLQKCLSSWADPGKPKLLLQGTCSGSRSRPFLGFGVLPDKPRQRRHSQISWLSSLSKFDQCHRRHQSSNSPSQLESEGEPNSNEGHSKEGTQEEQPMMKVLNVAEKNDAAKRIANLLANGNVQTRNSFSVYNKLYQFQYNFRNQPAQMVMTSVSGHLLNYEFDDSYRKWHSCDPVALFDAPVMKKCTENMKDIKKTLEAQAPHYQVLIIWTDCDREGENIGYEVISVCQRFNPRLQVLRAKFSEITKHAVETAMNNLIQPDKRVSDAVDVRQELDLRIGAAFTRFQTLRLTRKFPAALADRLISYGSCQFPTLGFVVERYKSIQDFIREDFWKIDVTHNVDDFVVNFSWARVRLFEKLAVQSIFEACLDNPLARVVKVQSKPKSKWRPVALDTIEFEKLASRKLKIGAKDAMQIAEQLYTSGLISYPRTETNIFPPSLDLTTLVQQQTGSNQWGGFANRLLQSGGPTPRNGKKTDQAHPPIHPTKFDNLSSLSDRHKKVYELIVRHFLACCSKDALGKETVVEIDIAGEKFIANGLTVIERNYLEVYIYDKWSDKEIPDFTNGQTFRPTKIEMSEGKTSPPNLLTEADLIALMEKHGIGTDATHAEHIETIKNRQYVGVQGIHFIPGKLGMGLVEGYDAMGFEMSKPHLRASFESDLQKICQGARRPEVVLREQVQKYKEVFVHATDQVIRLDEALARLLNENGGGAGGGNSGGGTHRGGGGGGGSNQNPRRRDDDDDDEDDDDQGGNNNTRASATVNTTVRSNTSTRNVAQRPVQRPPPTTTQRPGLNSIENNSSSGSVQCSCGTDPEIKTTRKEGPNLGRQFYKCDTCGFFQWVDEAGSSTRGQRTFNSSGYGTQSSSSNTSSSYAPSHMGPPPAPRSNAQRNQNFSNQSQSRGSSHDEENTAGGIPRCSCNKPANQYTVRKEGANKGRKFLACAVPYGQDGRCDFFQWDDEGIGNSNDAQRGAPAPHTSYTGVGTIRKGGARGGGQPGVRRARRCGICHQEGHTRRNCHLAGGEDDEEEGDY